MSGGYDEAAPSGPQIVEAIVEELAVRRRVPQFYLLDERGRVIAWPASGAGAIVPALRALIEMYFAQPPAQRRHFSEVVDVDGTLTAVRVVPFGAPEGGDHAVRFGLIVDRFATRSRERSETTDLTTAT